METVYISVITFDSDARQVVPLTGLDSFVEPSLSASGSTSLGEALRVLCRSVDAEVKRNTTTQKGDYKPLVFIMTDGEPTDSWESAIPELKKHSWAGIIACGAGPGAKTEPLKKITEVVVLLHEAHELRKFFKWVTDSIKTASSSLKNVPAPDAAPHGVSLPPPPQGITIVP